MPVVTYEVPQSIKYMKKGNFSGKDGIDFIEYREKELAKMLAILFSKCKAATFVD